MPRKNKGRRRNADFMHLTKPPVVKKPGGTGREKSALQGDTLSAAQLDRYYGLTQALIRRYLPPPAVQTRTGPRWRRVEVLLALEQEELKVALAQQAEAARENRIPKTSPALHTIPRDSVPMEWRMPKAQPQKPKKPKKRNP